MRIVVLAGGLSTERDVSISSGIKVASALREKGNEVVLLDVFMGYEENFCDIDALFKHNYSFTDSLGVGTEIPDIKTVKENRLDKSSKFIGMNVIEICAEADITYLALHGGEGENGQIQATLDLFGIKYTGSGYLGSALAMNKALTKSVLIQNRVTTPAGRVYKSAQDAEDWSYYPCVVKPCSGGSSVGITKAENRASEDRFPSPARLRTSFTAAIAAAVGAAFDKRTSVSAYISNTSAHRARGISVPWKVPEVSTGNLLQINPSHFTPISLLVTLIPSFVQYSVRIASLRKSSFSKLL